MFKLLPLYTVVFKGQYWFPLYEQLRFQYKKSMLFYCYKKKQMKNGINQPAKLLRLVEATVVEIGTKWLQKFKQKLHGPE